MNNYLMKPEDIESRSFQIINDLLSDRKLPKEHEHIIKRCIHTSADFDYADSLYFSEGVEKTIHNSFLSGAIIVTDTKMALSGINKKLTSKYGIQAYCFMSDEDVAVDALKHNITRAVISMEKAAKLGKRVIFVIGNAPTALIKIYQMYSEKKFIPDAVIAVPVGFVNVIESKELIIRSGLPCIVSRGRKGGSNIAAAICNAVLLKM